MCVAPLRRAVEAGAGRDEPDRDLARALERRGALGDHRAGGVQLRQDALAEGAALRRRGAHAPEGGEGYAAARLDRGVHAYDVRHALAERLLGHPAVVVGLRQRRPGGENDGSRDRQQVPDRRHGIFIAAV
jgi:hypothetical protein